MKHNNRGIFYIFIAALLWSTGGLGIKLVDAPPLFIATARCLIAGVLFIPFIKFRSITFSWNLVGLLISFTLTLTTFVTATKLTASANAIALQSTSPIWLFLLETIQLRKVRLEKILPIGLISVGIILFLMEPNKGSNATGNLIALSSGLSFAALIHFMGQSYPLSRMGLISLCNLVSAATLIFFVPVGQIVPTLDFRDICVLFYLGSIQIGVAYLFFMKGLKTVTSLKASIAVLLEPVLNPLWVYLMIGELPTIYGFLGEAAILLGVVADNLINVGGKVPNSYDEKSVKGTSPLSRLPH